ncbi:protein DGCR6L-like [Oscarella lobularis]|uniref:protein DGCR6L-like n=1 Tax=Oscarella lobularis TaxID=121494 RepID=UPI003313363C
MQGQGGRLYKAHVDPSVLARVREEWSRQQTRQKRHSRYVDVIRELAAKLSEEQRRRVSSDVIYDLATSLLDGTVFEIVRELEEIQQILERDLLNRRMKVVNVQRASQSAETPEGEAAMREVDQGIILDLDQRVAEQQATLQRAGIPCMMPTNKREDIVLQMEILRWIQRLSRL